MINYNSYVKKNLAEYIDNGGSKVKIGSNNHSIIIMQDNNVVVLENEIIHYVINMIKNLANEFGVCYDRELIYDKNNISIVINHLTSEITIAYEEEDLVIVDMGKFFNICGCGVNG